MPLRALGLCTVSASLIDSRLLHMWSKDVCE